MEGTDIRRGGGGLPDGKSFTPEGGPILGYINNPDGTTLQRELKRLHKTCKINQLFTLVLAARFCVETIKRRKLLWEQYLFTLVLAGALWLHKTW